LDTDTVSTLNRRNKSLAIIQQGLLLVGMLSIVLLIPKSWVTFWDYPKMIIVHIVAMLSLLISIIKGWNRSLDILDLSILFFVSWQFLSYTWSQYPGLVWYEAFHWLILMGIYFVVRKTDFSLFNKKLWAWVFLGAMVFNYGVLVYFHVEQYFSSGSGLSFSHLNMLPHYSTYNCNYTTATLVILLPVYIAITQWIKINRFVLLSFIAIHSGLILICNSRASAIALVVVGICSMLIIKRSTLLSNIKVVLPFTMATILAILMAIDNPKVFVSKLNPLLSIDEKSNDERLELWKRSLKLLQLGPLRGHGSNTWQIQHMQFGYSEIKLGGPRQYVHAHNLLLETGAELGLIGLLALLCILILPIYHTYNKKKKGKITSSDYALINALVAFIIISSFYGITFTDHKHFGSNDIFLMVIVGILSRGSSVIYTSKIMVYLLLILVSSSFVYKLYIRDKRNKLQEYHELRRNKADIKQLWQKYNSIYHPVFYTYDNYAPLLRLKADLLWSSNQEDDAINIMHHVIKGHPYRVQNWLRLGQMHLKRKDYSNSINAFNSATEINKWYLEARFKSAEVALMVKDWDTFNRSISFYEEWLIEYLTDPESVVLAKEYSHPLIIARCNLIDRSLNLLYMRQTIDK